MKHKASHCFTKQAISLAALAGVLTLGSFTSLSSSADENNQGHEGERWAPEFHGRDAHASRRGYFLGVCVGQTLAQQGIEVPVPQPGEKPTLDSSTEAAMKTAAESCRAEMRGTTASPSPSGAPSTTPSGAPTVAPPTAPSGVATPTPTEPSIPVPTESIPAPTSS